MFSMCSELAPRAHIPDTRIPQLMQPWPGVVNEQNGGRNAHTLESSLCTTMVEIWPRISKGKLREIPGSIFGNCAFSPPVVEAGATYKDLVGVAALP